MKEFWYWAEEYDKKLITSAIEAGAKAIILSDPDKEEEVKRLGRIEVFKEGRDFEYVLIKSKEDEERAGKYPPNVKVVVETTDWTIIPLENLIAQREELYAVVKNEEEARTAIKILEKGVKGVVLKSKDINVIKKVGKVLEEEEETLPSCCGKDHKDFTLGFGRQGLCGYHIPLKQGRGHVGGQLFWGHVLGACGDRGEPLCSVKTF